MKGLDRDRLIQLSGERAFRRGEEYFSWRRVRSFTQDDGHISAIVDGTQSYRVGLRGDEGQLGYECNCPEGALGRFCKHCVAVSLGWLEVEKGESAQAAATRQALQNNLAGLATEELVEFVLRHAMRDTHFRERLRLCVARANGNKPDLNDIARLFDFATQVAASAEDDALFSDVLKEVEITLALLLEEGFAEWAVALIESSAAFLFLNDTEAVKKLQTVLLSYHQWGCRQSGFTPESIAQQLLAWQSRCSAIAQGEIVDSYSSLLGQRGRKAYRLLVQNEWDRLHGVGGHHTLEQRERCARLAGLIEHLARGRRDIDTLITVKSCHLEEADDYLELARLYKQAGEGELALEWARRGTERFPAHEAEELYEFLAGEYVGRDAWQEVLEISFKQFCARPTLRSYQRVADHAQAVGNWGIWREQALGILRQQNLLTDTRHPKRPPTSDQSTLVSILLWENEDEEAWQAAQLGGCGDDLWQEIAKRFSKKRPDDALRIYKRLVTRYASRKNRYSYQAIIEALRRIARLLKKQKRQDEFIPYVESLCRKHRYQHAFVKMLRQLAARHSRTRSRAKR